MWVSSKCGVHCARKHSTLYRCTVDDNNTIRSTIQSLSDLVLVSTGKHMQLLRMLCFNLYVVTNKQTNTHQKKKNELKMRLKKRQRAKENVKILQIKTIRNENVLIKNKRIWFSSLSISVLFICFGNVCLLDFVERYRKHMHRFVAAMNVFVVVFVFVFHFCFLFFFVVECTLLVLSLCCCYCCFFFAVVIYWRVEKE